jgi:hypothetical protein
MTIKRRIIKLELTRQAAEPVVIHVFTTDEDGMCRRTNNKGETVEEMPEAEFDRKYPSALYVPQREQE